MHYPIRNKMIFIFLIIISITSFGQVKLPKLISDGMVLQRNSELKIWGWASAGEKISIQFIDKNYNTTTDNKGDWSVTIPAHKAGGPYEMKINANNSITIHDIMIGDVWVCSGPVEYGTANEKSKLELSGRNRTF